MYLNYLFLEKTRLKQGKNEPNVMVLSYFSAKMKTVTAKLELELAPSRRLRLAYFKINLSSFLPRSEGQVQIDKQNVEQLEHPVPHEKQNSIGKKRRLAARPNPIY